MLTYNDIQNGEYGSSVRTKINGFNNAVATQVNSHITEISNINGAVNAIEVVNNDQANTLISLQNQIDGKSAAHTLVLEGYSFITQAPTAVNTPIQVSFGAAQTLAKVSIDALGSITFNTAGSYSVVLNATYGRSSSTGIAILFGRFELNGVMLGKTIAMKSDAAQMTLPYTQTGIGTFAAGDVLKFKIYRDSAGTNEGSLFSIPSSLAGWEATPSAQIQLYEV